jgi:fibro-slime domain-containing protein
MLRAWIPSLIIIPLAVAAAATGCGVGTEGSRDLGPSTGGSSSGSGGSSSGNSGSSGSTGGGIKIDMMEGGNVDVCAAAGLPPGCETMIPPGCGDGMQNQDSEECDDGNTVPGDCCSGACKVEQFCACPPGEACYSTIVCGDGDRGPGEACDDGNADAGDGCAADCRSVELGYACTVPGEKCVRHYTCGDGIPDPNEGCDDKNFVSGDGCSEHCRIEQGFKCSLDSPSVCTSTTCGDKVKEGAESCDDGNVVGFDGCSPDCRAEPTCPTGMPCMSSCGDGILFGDEVCDDGNSRDGDGCSSTCQREEGYVCSNEAPCTTKMGVDPTTGAMMDICTLTVPAVFRDFTSGASGHPDFQPGFTSNGAVQGIVEETLDAEGKPALKAGLSAAVRDSANMNGPAEYAQWYRDDPPSSGPIPGEIVLWDNGAGGYVNRWGANGEQWKANPTTVDYGEPRYGGPGGTGCEACVLAAGEMCYDPCPPWNDGQACCATIPTTGSYDGNPLFFPLDGKMGVLGGARSEGKVPAQYGWNGWPWETAVATTLGVTNVPTATAPFPSTMHNYSFTTEVKYWFKYTSDLQATLDFTGDDDVWVFLNGHLSVDMGGWHVPTNGTLTIDSGAIAVRTQTNADDMGVGPVTMKNGTAMQYGLTDGNVYQIQIFHAERQTEGSSFRLTLAGFNMTPSDCVTDCGDGMVGPGEECDDGMNVGAYNGCGAGCLFGPRCGDNVVQSAEGEVCDEGPNNTGAYGGCGPDCQPGPRCGDGVVTDGEQCDDTANMGAYGGCAPGCVIGPHCGDGSIAVSVDPMTNAPYEQCDDGNSTSNDGCSNCKLDVAVTK